MESYERDILKKMHLFEQRLNEDKRSELNLYRNKMRVNKNF